MNYEEEEYEEIPILSFGSLGEQIFWVVFGVVAIFGLWWFMFVFIDGL